MDLVIQLYVYAMNINKEGEKTRQEEINECLFHNMKNPVFSTIHILLEKASDLEYYTQLIDTIKEKTKCKFTIYGRQPYYSDLIWYISTNIENNKTVCIMNSDIFMGYTTNEFIEKELDYDTFISLTRHEFTSEGHPICNVSTCELIYKYYGSHDAFIFKTPIPESFNYHYVNIPQNVNGAEAVFMRAWVDAGKKLKNLCFDIPIYHMHKNRFYIKSYPTIANHTLCNIKPSVPKDRLDIQSQIIQMF